MRYESKHSYFKQHARKCKNFKNIFKTLANKHQQDSALELNDFSIKDKMGSLVLKNNDNIKNNFNINFSFHEVKYYNHGYHYRPGLLPFLKYCI